MTGTASRATTSSGKLGAASAAGAVAAAFASSLCCLGPLLLAALGLGGAGLLANLEGYRPYLSGLTLALLGAGFYLTYRRRAPATQAAGGGPACDCERPRASHLARIALWIAAVAAAAFLGFPYLTQALFG